MNGVFVEPLYFIQTPVVWQETEVPFVVNYSNFTVETDTGVLTLGDNVVLKFTSSSELGFDGTNLNNANGPGVAFTSFKDDTLKGDTNGDGNATTPGTGDWEGIYNDNNGQYMSWSNIYYAAN